MENSRAYGRRRGFDMGNVIGDPFALATISIGMLAWLISFIGSLISQINSTSVVPFSPYNWWTVVLSIFVIGGVFTATAMDCVQNYHVAITTYIGISLVLTTSSVNNLIYSPLGAREAAAAGFLLLSMVFAVWILYFGSAPSATPRAFVDSFALQKESTINRPTMGGGYGASGRPETSTSVQPPQMYTSAQLNGFENPSPVAGVSQQRNSLINPPFSAPKSVPQSSTPVPPTDSEVVPPTEYPYRAKAIYSYEANPDDANEISFSKHEILEVSDVSGRWWQARKENGETGIAPSNYLILL